MTADRTPTREASGRPTRAPTRWRVEMRDLAGELVFAADSFAQEHTDYLVSQLRWSRSRVPRTLRWRIHTIAYDIVNEVIYEELA